MSSRDLLFKIAKDMGKNPQDFKKFIEILEENMFDTVESLEMLTEDELKNDLKLPLGLVKQITKNLQNKPELKTE